MMKCFLVLVSLLIAGISPARAQLNAAGTWVTASGTNTLTATVPGVVAQGDLLGVPVRFIPPNSNTTAVTFNPNSIGGIAVKKPTRGGLVALTGGEIQAAQEAQLLWDGTEYVCVTCVNTYKLPTYQYLTSLTPSQTYTTPAGVTSLEIKQIGAGGGGGSPGTGAGGTGGTTTFGSTTTIGGNGGANSTTAGTGGSGGTTGTGTVIRRLSGGAGNAGVNATQASGATLTFIMTGGGGCVSQFAGASPSSPSTATPVAAIANTGSGGAGASVQIASGAGTYNSGGAGGCGEYVEYFVNAPAATYTYTNGLGGTAGSTNASVGSSGGIVVKENYN